MSTLISITSFLKNSALVELLESLIALNYHEGNKILIADDSENAEARAVFEQFKKKCKLVYCNGMERTGIAVNKNRGLKYFFAKPHFNDILMLDDDIVFHREKLLDHLKMACADARLSYMTGYWTDHNASKEENIKGASGNGWYSDFPIKASTDYVTWNEGCQGVLMYIQREIAEKVMYMRKYSYVYGYEHDSYMARILRADGKAPNLKPVLKGCEYFYIGQNKPNAYEIDREIVLGKMDENGKVIEIGQQAREHGEDLLQIIAGYGIKEKNHYLKKSKEIVLES